MAGKSNLVHLYRKQWYSYIGNSGTVIPETVVQLYRKQLYSYTENSGTVVPEAQVLLM